MVVVAPDDCVAVVLLMIVFAVVLGFSQHLVATSPEPELHAAPVSLNDWSISAVVDARMVYANCPNTSLAKVKSGTLTVDGL